ncbi:MAG: hypothetical protein J5I99_10390 [Verrucomicrobia bacterium]|nr:hypothetical protein [Verrucomicrobiota bacterium]
MVRLMRLGLAVCVLVPWLGASAANPPLQTVVVTQNQSVASGSALFMAVDREELNSLTTTGAVRMYNAGGNTWVGRIAVPRSTTKTNVPFKFLTRTMSSGSYCNTGNGSLTGALQSASSALWSPGYSGKTVYYHSALTNVTIFYRKSDGSWEHSPVMTRLGAGRNGNESRYVVSGIGEPGQPLVFVGHGYENGVEKWDNPAVGGIDNNYVTSLDTFFLQDGNIFNYEPPATVSAPQVISVGSWTSSYTGNGIPSRPGRIYLPRGYTENTWKHYPVLYMHDGQNVFDPGGPYGSWSAEVAATAEIAGGRMRETIIVAVDNTGSRMDEYGTPQDGHTGNYYLMYLAHNVKPNIDANYRTLTDRMNNGTLGSSLGGLISAYCGLSSNVFGLAGAMSPSYWYGPNFASWINSQPTKGSRIWMDMGTAESDGSMWTPFWPVYESLLSDGYVVGDDLKIAVGCGEGHNEAAWAKRVGPAMRFLYNVWDESNSLETNAPPPAPGAVRFSSASYQVNENGGSISISVSRTGGSDGAASVSYATSNGTALAGSAYTAASGTLNWANGDATSKTFSVSIANNGVYEGDKTFYVKLSGASGAALGSPSSAIVTIEEDEPVPPDVAITNPPTAIVVGEGTASYDLKGTAFAANWTGFRWTNNLTGDSGTQALASAWTIANVPLGHGTNVIAVSVTRPGVSTVTNAADDATAGVYGDGWQTADNGGSGFGAWTLTAVGNAGHFVHNGMWGFWSQEPTNLAEAIRPFSSALATGQTFHIRMKNGWIWESGGSVGIALRDGGGNTLWELFFNGGDTNYSVTGGSTDIPWTDAGLDVSFSVVSPGSYSVKVVPNGGSARTYLGSFSGSVSELRAWSYSNGTSDTNNSNRDFYINDLKITAAAPSGEVSTSATAVITREGPALHDGIPLSWWNQYGLGTNSAAAADNDGDGASNWEEYIADTDPTQTLSHYPNAIVHMEGSGVLQLQAGPPTTNSRVYDVWHKADLMSGAWAPLNLDVPGANDGGALQLLVTNAAGVGFFRTGVKLID